jgi:hypothetical protein
LTEIKVEPRSQQHDQRGQHRAHDHECVDDLPTFDKVASNAVLVTKNPISIFVGCFWSDVSAIT